MCFAAYWVFVSGVLGLRLVGTGSLLVAYWVVVSGVLGFRLVGLGLDRGVLGLRLVGLCHEPLRALVAYWLFGVVGLCHEPVRASGVVGLCHEPMSLRSVSPSYSFS